MNKLKRVVRNAVVFIKKLRLDYASAYAAQAAFFILLSLFPFAMLVYSAVSLIPVVSNGSIIQLFDGLLPNAFNSFLRGIFTEASEEKARAATTISVTALIALWSASKGMMSLIRGLNRVCAIEEKRNYFHIRGIACAYTVGLIILIVLAAVLIVFAKNIAYAITDIVPAGKGVIETIYSYRIIIILALLVLSFMIFYRFLPNRRSTFRREFLGAFAAAAGWIGFSYIYSYYITSFASSSVYGSLTTVVFFMLWLYICFYIFFVGAEINTFYNRDESVIEFIRQYYSHRKK